MNEFFKVSICIDDDNNYDNYYFSSHEKAIEFAKPHLISFCEKLQWNDILDEALWDLENYGEFSDLIYIRKITIDDGKSY